MDVLRGAIIVLMAVIPVMFLYAFAVKHWWLLFAVCFIPFSLCSIFACWVVGYCMVTTSDSDDLKERGEDNATR